MTWLMTPTRPGPITRAKRLVVSIRPFDACRRSLSRVRVGKKPESAGLKIALRLETMTATGISTQRLKPKMIPYNGKMKTAAPRARSAAIMILR